MSLVYPPEAHTRRRADATAPQSDAAIAAAINNAEHEKIKKGLVEMIQQQARRVEDLRVDTAMNLEHQAGLRRMQLIDSRNDALAKATELAPTLAGVREEWNYARDQNRDFEMQWGSMRARQQQVSARVDAAKEQTEATRRENESLRAQIKQLREHLARISRDKTTMKEKMKRAFECVVVDDSFLKNRLMEEERYSTQLSHALQAMQSEYQDYQSQHRAEFAPLEADVRLLNDYLQHMQERTRELQRYCLDVEQKASNLEASWMDLVHNSFEPLERANTRHKLKATVVSMLQSLERNIPEGAAMHQCKGDGDDVWHACHAEVWDAIVREVTSEKQKIQRRDQSHQMVAAGISQQLQTATNRLAALKLAAEGSGTNRRMCLREIRDLAFIGTSKRNTEEVRIRDIKEAATVLDEDLSMVLHFIRKEGFNDYVSSTDGEDDEEEDGGFPPLAEEGNADIAALISSYELDPENPESVEVIHRNLHRPTGPLQSFATQKADFLSKNALSLHREKRRAVSSQPLKETLERAVQAVQEASAKDDVAYVRNRDIQIRKGLLDPRTERVHLADEMFTNHAREVMSRIERWIAANKAQQESGEYGAISTLGAAGGARGGVTDPSRVAGVITIPNARVPREIERGTPEAKVSYFVGQALVGARIVLYPRKSLQPQYRHVFLSRDLSTFICQRITTVGEEDIRIRVADIASILVGHQTDVFRDARTVSKAHMSEQLAFSLITASGATYDLECDSADDRTMWANVFAFIVNESRRGGMLSALLENKRISVVDVMNRSPEHVEVADRGHLKVVIS